MDTLKLGNSPLINMLVKLPGMNMESRLRRLLHDPEKLLHAGGVAPGQTVLEVGCGTGYFTIPACKMVGESGHIIAIDPVAGYVRRVRKKAQHSGLANVDVLRRDALDTELENESIDVALLYGVLPFPTLPLERLLPEMHRVLKPEGLLAVWLFPMSFGVPEAISQSNFFSDMRHENGVYRFRRSAAIMG